MVKIRGEAPADEAGIRALHCAAFPTAAEADLVERLRSDGDCIVSLVAADGDEIVGHILLSRMAVEGDGRRFDCLALAPVAVLPDHQRQGIGSGLIHVALRKAEALGNDIVFVLGEPDYYARFGFDAATAAPFASPYSGPYLQALVLRRGAKLPAYGSAGYAPAFAQLA